MFDDDFPKVSYDFTEKEWTLTRGKHEIFLERMIMSVAFGDPLELGNEDSAVAVLGRDTQKRVHVVFLASAIWEELLPMLVDIKDYFAIRRLMIPDEPEEYWDEAAYVEGLTYYRLEDIPESRTNKKRLVSDVKQWPYFRDRDLLVSLDLIPKELEKSLPAIATRFDKDSKDGKVLIWATSGFDAVAMSFGESLREAVSDPRIVSVLQGYTTLRSRQKIDENPFHTPKPWYKGEEG